MLIVLQAPVSGPGYAVKSIINPLTCLAMHNHFCWTKVDESFTSKTFGRWQHASVDVDPHVALLHHYKRCHLTPEQCHELIYNSTVEVDDIVAKKYGKSLKWRVSKTLRELGILLR